MNFKSLATFTIRIAELALVALAATALESSSIAIGGGLFLGVLWAYNDRNYDDKLEKH